MQSTWTDDSEGTQQSVMKTCPRCGREFQDPTTLCPLDGTVLEKSGDELVGQMITDRYRIDERISEGGMGTVYRATHVLMDKRVAIKVLHPSLAADDKIVARFSREARAASRISHPHALNVTDFGESQTGVVFLVMEFLDGRTLKDVIQTEGPMPLKRAVEILRQVAGALDAAHAEGVVHRDLKSDNIMLMEGANGSDWAKVLDFGIAKIKENAGHTDPALTAPNLIIGTPQYMSPEQCSQASEIDSRSDIYSLGIIIYEMLTGHVPFTGDSPTAIMMKHLQEPPPSVMEERDDLPPQVGMVITSALAKRPEDRFQTAGELSEAFTAAAAGQEVPEHALSASTNPATAASETNRIVVPTGSNEAPRNTREQEMDEETVISARPAAVAAYDNEGPRTTRVSEPLPQKSSPWRVVIPALAGLLVLVGVIYAITYRGNPAQPSANQAPPLTTDPNSKPVQAAPPPTGNAEQGVAPSSNSNTSNSNTGGTDETGAKPAENKNAEGTAAGAENANTGNANRKERGQNNSNQGGQNSNDAPANNNQEQEEEPPPPPKSNSNGEAPPDQSKPKPKKAEPGLPPPPPTSNISVQEQ